MSDDKPRSGADVERTVQDFLSDSVVPGRVSRASAERVKEAAESIVKRADRDASVNRAFGRAS